MFLVYDVFQLIHERTKGYGTEDLESDDKIESAAQTCVGVFKRT